MSTLPAAIVNEKRSNLPFLSRLAFLIAAIALYAYAAPQGALGAALGAGVMLFSFAVLVHWGYKETMKNKALMESLDQSELVSMLGRHGETWRSTESVVRELDRRFPAWREGASAA